MRRYRLLFILSLSCCIGLAACTRAYAQVNAAANADAGAQTSTRSGDLQMTKALLGAADQGDADALELLLQRGASPNSTDEDGWSPLMFAAAGGHLAALTVLQKAGAKVNHAAKDGSTALHLAAFGGSVGVVRALLSGGADPWLKDSEGRRASDLAQAKGHVAIYEIISSEATPRKRAERPTDPYGPILGVVQLGMKESQVREILGQRFSQAQVLGNGTYLIRRYVLWGGSGAMRVGFDSEGRLELAVYTLTLADRYEANRALAAIEPWAQLARPIDTALKRDVLVRNEGDYLVGVEYAASATAFSVEIRLKSASSF